MKGSWERAVIHVVDHYYKKGWINEKSLDNHMTKIKTIDIMIINTSYLDADSPSDESVIFYFIFNISGLH